MRAVRKLRHWKQRFDENAKFIWRRSVLWEGESVQVGDPIPDSLANNRAKLRRFWQSQIIELAVFEEPDVATGHVPDRKDEVKARTPEEMIRKETDRKWLVEGLTETFPSKTKALEAAAAMLAEAAKVAAAEKPEDETDETGDGEKVDETGAGEKTDETGDGEKVDETGAGEKTDETGDGEKTDDDWLDGEKKQEA